MPVKKEAWKDVQVSLKLHLQPNVSDHINVSSQVPAWKKIWKPKWIEIKVPAWKEIEVPAWKQYWVPEW